MTLTHLGLVPPPARAVFGGRADGNASIRVGEHGWGGRRAVLARLGLEPCDAVFMRQIHGREVARVGARDRGRGALPGVDGLVTTDTDVALVVLTADCVPVLLLDEGRGIAAAHAGRRGVEAEVVPEVVTALLAATGSPARRLRALVGPAIGGCCYELPEALADRLPEARTTTAWGAPSVDLPTAVVAQLEALGVGSVVRQGGCTRCESDRWFTHRGSGAWGAPEGRNASAIVRGAG